MSWRSMRMKAGCVPAVPARTAQRLQRRTIQRMDATTAVSIHADRAAGSLGIVWADGVDEIALEALCDQDRGHRRCGQCEPADRLSWPIAGIGRILSPRFFAGFSGG